MGVVGVGMGSMDMVIGDVGVQGVGRGRHGWRGRACVLSGRDKATETAGMLYNYSGIFLIFFLLKLTF